MRHEPPSAQREWVMLSKYVSDLAARWKSDKHYRHGTDLIVRVYAWAACHSCPTYWACEAANWPAKLRPRQLPDQSTMSRRLRSDDYKRFVERLMHRLAGHDATTLAVYHIDGSPLSVADHTTDPDAEVGPKGKRMYTGYKLHALWRFGGLLPEKLQIHSADVCEKTVARELLALGNPGCCGYVCGDGFYDASVLYDIAAGSNLQMLVPRSRPGTGLGHHYQSPHRKRAIASLEVSKYITRFGKKIYASRRQVEREFSGLKARRGGLGGSMPSWVRRLWRVTAWVKMHLLLNAMRLLRLQRKTPAAA